MIYTLGHKESYDTGLSEMGSDFKKLGVDLTTVPAYLGGSVWETREQVAEYYDMHSLELIEFAVYGVEAD